MERLLNFLALLRTRLWIVPSIMSLGGLSLAYALLGPLREWASFGQTQLWWLYSGDASSARNLLGALLSGAITMTSLVVSLTFVTLTLAASQLGPRLIVNFIADREIQAVLGLFLATILYLVIVMRTIGGELGPDTVPHLAITIASVLTIGCMFALLFYVHKVSRAIIADNVIEHVYRDLQKLIESTIPEKQETKEREPRIPGPRSSISLDQVGYVQTIDYKALASWAETNCAVLDVHVRAGDFVLRRGRHIDIAATDAVPEDAIEGVRSAVVVGAERSPAQDLEYSIRQLVELALRALSPGINDPFTAIAVIDKLGAAMELILSRPALVPEIYDKEDKLRVVAVRADAASLADSCFNQIRDAAANSTAVLVHLLCTFEKLAASCGGADAVEIISKHADRLEETFAGEPRPRSEQIPFRKRLETVRRRCQSPGRLDQRACESSTAQ